MTPSSSIRGLSENTWNPPESVRRWPSQPVKRCRPPRASTTSAPGSQHQVVGVGQDHLRAEPVEVVGVEQPDRAAGADRHEARGGERPSGRVHHPGPGRAVDVLDAPGGRALTPGRRVLSHDHGVAERQEAVAVAEGLVVQGPPPGAAKASSSTSRLERGMVEVGHQHVDHREPEAGPDEQIALPLEVARSRPRSRGPGPSWCRPPPPGPPAGRRPWSRPGPGSARCA